MRDLGERADENLTILEGMAQVDFYCTFNSAGRAGILFAHPEIMYATKLSGNCCFLNFIIRMLSVRWLTSLTVMLIGKFVIFIPKFEMFCDLVSVIK